jgi:hypothetical protein
MCDSIPAFSRPHRFVYFAADPYVSIQPFPLIVDRLHRFAPHNDDKSLTRIAIAMPEV